MGALAVSTSLLEQMENVSRKNREINDAVKMSVSTVLSYLNNLRILHRPEQRFTACEGGTVVVKHGSISKAPSLAVDSREGKTSSAVTLRYRSKKGTAPEAPPPLLH